jgi:hypothetical protein
MLKLIIILSLLVVAGCTSTATSNGNTQTGQGAQVAKPAFTQAKVKQWFVTDNPYTLPADKLERMNTTGGGFGDY